MRDRCEERWGDTRCEQALGHDSAHVASGDTGMVIWVNTGAEHGTRVGGDESDTDH